jgi:hypothetical protein
MWEWSDKLKLGKGSAFIKRDLRLLPLTEVEFEADFFFDRASPTKRQERWMGMIIEREVGSLLAMEEVRLPPPTVNNLATLLAQDGSRFRFEYEYDFGDGWEHEVLFEGCMHAEKGVRYPLCLEGERACPPEDVGGTDGYREYLEAMADPQHEEHDPFMEWRGPFDPEAFSAEEATKAMRRGLPNWREMEGI